MEKIKSITTFAAMLALPTAALATDCTKWSAHAPGYCGVLGNDAQCASSANRVPGKCAIPNASFYVNSAGDLIDNQSQSIEATAGSFVLVNPDGSNLVMISAGNGNIVAQGGGNIVAQGGGNLAGARTLFSVRGKRVFVRRR